MHKYFFLLGLCCQCFTAVEARLNVLTIGIVETTSKQIGPTTTMSEFLKITMRV